LKKDWNKWGGMDCKSKVQKWRTRKKNERKRAEKDETNGNRLDER
jgi:hypothetical protein